MRRKLIFIVAADLIIGLGHYKRSHYLALEFYKKNWDVEFVVITKKRPDYFDKNFKYSYFKTFSEFLNYFKFDERNKEFDLIITDIIYLKIFKDKNALHNIYQKLKELNAKICAIDALGEFSLLSQNLLLNIDILIRPYFCESTKYFSFYNRFLLEGEKFIILPEIFQKRVKKNISSKGSKVLITCGGSDPKSFTSEIIEALNLINNKISIRIIIGPLFSFLNKKKINSKVNKSIHQIEVIENEESLYKHFLWSDLVISASGLTKYEIAATGTPSLLFSIDKDNFEINNYFSSKGICRDHGIGIDKEKMYLQVKKILSSNYIRKNLSSNSSNLIDGKGCIRIVNKISEIIK